MTVTLNRSHQNIDQVLQPQTRLDLIFDVDLINDYIDVRTARVQDVTSRGVIVSQSTPPIQMSMVGRSLEATFVMRDPVENDVVRWGWWCQVQEVLARYKKSPQDTETLPAVVLSLPGAGGLVETNARMDYRLSISGDQKLSIQTHPSFGQVNLLDFSAGGVLISVPRPPQAKVGMRLWFTLFFPVQSAPGKPTTINGEAEVVRVTTNEGEIFARVALKFLDLDLNAVRSLQKAINFYILEEQRNRTNDVPPKSPNPAPKS